MIEPRVEWSEFPTAVATHNFGTQLKELNVPDEEHVAIPPPVYPLLQFTATVDPVVPKMDPEVALSEFAT